MVGEAETASRRWCALMPPEVILMDLMMPVMMGQRHPRLKTKPQNPDHRPHQLGGG
jgi:CheY-like chemotaxis protein